MFRVHKSVAEWFNLSPFEISVIVAIFLITTLLAILIAFVCRKQRRTPSTLDSAKATLRSSKSTQNGSSRSRRNRREQRGHEGDMCNPLVPKQTQAPALGTTDRPPPPLPPKLKGGQIYTNLAHFHSPSLGVNQHQVGTSGLPTVEVKPIQQQRKPAAPPHRKLLENGSSCCPSPVAMKSGSSCEQSHARHRHSRRSNSGSQRSLHHHRHPSSSTENEASSDDVLRQFGRKVHCHDHRQSSQLHCSHVRQSQRGSFTSTIPLNSSTQIRDGIGDSIQCLHQEASEHMGNGKRRTSPDKPSEYTTMKPVHRANPFRIMGQHQATANGAIDKNNNDGQPPPPPSHRTIPNGPAPPADPPTSSTNLYDNPNNEEDGTLSNLTSQAFEDIDADQA